MCSLLLTHPSALSGSSWRLGALLKGLTSVMDNSCRSRDSNPQPQVTSPTFYPLEPWLTLQMQFCICSWFAGNRTRVNLLGRQLCSPLYHQRMCSLHLTHPKCMRPRSSVQLFYNARGAVRGSVTCSRAPQSWYWTQFLPARDSNFRSLARLSNH